MLAIKVQLAGGLGNNLFQLNAGIAHAIKFKKELLVLKPQNLESKFSHNFDSEILGNFNFIAHNHAAYLGLQKIKTRIENKLIKSNDFIAAFKGIDLPEEIGFSERVINERNLIELRGYYQSYRYSEYSENSLAKLLSLENPTKWFSEKTEEIVNCPSLASIHIRFGDYEKLKKSFGLLSADYYINSMEKLNETFGISDFWVFSDDTDYAKNLLKDSKFKLKFVSPPTNSPSSESLLLMSKFKAHIIGNSTYSWWGSSLSNVSRVTIYPEPWFRNLKPIRDLAPSEWIAEKSSWV